MKPRFDDRTSALEGIRRALAPSSVAVVGVSHNPSKWGSRFARSISDGGFSGDLFFINPKPGTFLGRDFVPSLTSVGKPVDLVIVSVPSLACSAVVREAGKLGCGCALVAANGFAESGNHQLQQELIDSGRESGIPIIGPNCLGVYSSPGHLNAIGDPSIPSGRIAVVAQSGNIGVAIYHAAKDYGLGLSYLVSIGNQADIAFEDVFRYLERDLHSDVVLLYTESFQDLPRYLDAASLLTQHIPVAVLRGGRSAAGARSAASHTGAMSGDDRIVSASLRRAGMLEVESVRDLLLAAMALADRTSLRGRSVSIVADSGGFATVGADAAIRAGLRVDPHPERLKDQLEAALSPQAATGNPVDTLGGPEIRPDILQQTVAACLEDSSIDGVALVGNLGGYGDFEGPLITQAERQAALELVEMRGHLSKPIVVQSIYSARTGNEAIEHLRSKKVPVVEDLEDAMKVLSMKARVVEESRWPRRQWSGLGRENRQGRVLTEDKSREWLAGKSPGIVPEWVVVSSEVGALHEVSSLGGPGTLKVLSSAAIHKTEVGGVFLNLHTEDEVRQAWRRIEAIAAELGENPRALVTRFRHSDIEALIGVFRHERLGPLVVVGSGGVFAPAMMDYTILFPPFSEDEVMSRVAQLFLGRQLSSVRAHEAMRSGLTNLAVAIGNLALADESLLELDLNPVALSSSGAQVLDVRAVVA